MLLEKEREKVVKYGRKLVENDLTRGTGGNLSIFNKDKKLIAISPSGIDYYSLTPSQVVVLDLEKEIVEGDLKPSSEVDLHHIFYKNRSDISSIIHTHSTFAAVMAVLGETLPAAHYMIALAGKNVRCADYATFGSEELARNAFEAMKDRRAVLLANHGLLAGGNSIENAFNIAEEIEFVAELYWRASAVGEPQILDKEEMELMKEKFKNYGQKGG